MYLQCCHAPRAEPGNYAAISFASTFNFPAHSYLARTYGYSQDG